MRTEKDAPLFATSLTQTVAAGVQADVYLRNSKPVAIVLWQGAEPQPFLAVRDSDDGRLQRFTLTANDDVPKHDRRESHLDSVVETRMQGEIIRSLALYEVGVAEPFLAVVGSDVPLRKHPFNDRSNGIFAWGFRDRDGMPVDDVFGAIMRATLHGRASRDWDTERVAALIGEYSSDQMARISEVVAEKSRDDQWRLAHQDNGIAGTDDLASILHQWPVSTEGAVPLVSVQVETNTFSFFVDEAPDGAKKVRVHQFTDFRGTILQDDFPLGSSNEWEASTPEGLSNLKAVDHVGRALLKDWDSLSKNYAPTVHIVRTFEAGGPDFRPGLGLGNKTAAFDSLQDALQHFMDTPATNLPRVYAGKQVLVEYDPDDGMDLRFRDSAAKAEYIKLETARLPPYNPDDMTAAVAYANATKALFAKGEHDQAFDLYMRDPNGGGQPAFHQTTKEQFVLGMYSGRDIQGNPLYPQPAGYQHAGVTVGHELQLQDNAWARIDHVFDFDGKPHVLVESEQGKRLISVAEVGQMRPAGEQLAESAPCKFTDIQPVIANTHDLLDDRLSLKHTESERTRLLSVYSALGTIRSQTSATVQDALPVLRDAHDLINERWSMPTNSEGCQAVRAINDLRTVLTAIEHGPAAVSGKFPPRVGPIYELRRLDGDKFDTAFYTRSHAKNVLDEFDQAKPLTFYVANTATGERHLSFAAKTELLKQDQAGPGTDQSAIFRLEMAYFEARDNRPAELNEGQRSAVATFADANGRDWKDKLHALWGNGNYRSRGIDTNQAALLQQVRNEFGPEWLSGVKRADLDAPKRADLDDAGMGM